jgi:hypothetical protein
MTTISVDGATTFVNIFTSGSNIVYTMTTPLTGTSNEITISWPCTLRNGNGTPGSSNRLVVNITNNLSLSTTGQYFAIGTGFITINGNGNTVTVSVASYPGLVRNGTNLANGSGNITIQNLGVLSTQTCANNAGWIGQYFYGKGHDTCITDNCYSTGGIGSYGGGINGANSTGTATNCYSTGGIGQYGGGINGDSSSGSATNCYSTGGIGQEGGGINGWGSFGTATKCYSTGGIGQAAGGINGQNSRGAATNCYSTGNIGLNAGGIYGRFVTNANAIATNCFSTGTILTSGNGIYGSNTTLTPVNCYSTNGAANWTDAAARAALLRFPDEGEYVGTTWTDTNANTTATLPWILSNTGTPPYNPMSSSITRGQSTTAATKQTGVTYSIITISSNNTFSDILTDTGISINSTTGVITTTNNTNIYRTYYIQVKQTTNTTTSATTGHPYTIGTYELTITDNPCFNEGTCILVLIDNIEKYVPIEQLKPGDIVKTYLHGYKKIDHIGKNTMTNNPDDFTQCMYRMKKTDEMTDDLIVTGWHAILVDELTEDEQEKQHFYKSSIDDKQLLLSSISDKFEKMENTDKYTYYHVALESDEEDRKYGIWANGVLTESISKKLFLNKPWEK